MKESGDWAGILSYEKDWKFIDDLYAFPNVIRLKHVVFLITGKWLHCYFSASLPSKYDSELCYGYGFY